jgi:hypothetical protein
MARRNRAATGLLKAGEDYLIALDYEVVERTEQGSFFYIFMRSLRMVEATRTIPIVFCGVADPVGAGFVDSLARPSGNATGFLIFEYSLSGKWLELLKEIAPGVTRAAALRDANIS